MADTPDTIRIDKWLWYARFFKTRSICAKLISDGRISLNDQQIKKPATVVNIGDRVMFRQGEWQRIVTIVGIGTRRGPASEAQELYEDLSPPKPKRENNPQNPKYEGKGRPTGKQRRALSSFSPKSLD